MAVIIGRNEIEAEIATSPSDLRAYLADEFARLLATPPFVEALEGFLAATVSNPIGPARLRALRARLDRIAGFAAADSEGAR